MSINSFRLYKWVADLILSPTPHHFTIINIFLSTLLMGLHLNVSIKPSQNIMRNVKEKKLFSGLQGDCLATVCLWLLCEEESVDEQLRGCMLYCMCICVCPKCVYSVN